MKEEYIKAALKKIKDPNILINVVSRRVHQLQDEGMHPLISTFEHLDPEDVALREIAEDKISYELYSPSAEQ